MKRAKRPAIVTPVVRPVPAGNPLDWAWHRCAACGHVWDGARVRYPLCRRCGKLGGLERSRP